MSPPPPSHHQSAKAKAATSSSSTITPPNSTTTTTSGATSSNPNMLNYLWIPFLMSLPTSSATEEAVSLVLPSDARDAFSRCPSGDPNLNFRPIIGILSHPGDGASGRLNNDTNASYIAASYVKFVESAGARVIPLIYNEPTDLLFKKLQLVNGVIFTGGWCKEGLYFDVVNSIFQYALAKNDSGDHFPLLAVCLGFELLTMIVSKDKNILEEFSASNQASTLQFTSDASIDGTLFQRFPPSLIAKLSTECLVMQNHRYGISPATFKKNKKLHNFFEILTTSTDENYQVYVSTVQALKYPVTAVQWHPEKNAFEWGSSQIPHSKMQFREARKSLNRPPTRKVLDSLIYNYRTTYGGKVGRGFDEVYIFSKLCSL